MSGVRSWIDTREAREGCWLHALADPQLADALSAIHAEPAAPWTLESLAGRSRMSRSSFAARFKTVVGETPMAYLTRWRMHRAADLLHTSDLPLRDIVASSGYASEAAFRTVFKRWAGESPASGSCKQPLLPAHPVALTGANFARQVESDVPLVVDFWASWCGPCRMMAPAFEQAAAELEPRVRLAKVNTDEAPGVGARLNIRSIPTIALFINGREVARQAGAMGASEIVRWAQAQLNRATTTV